nr:hydrogenase-2 assembly chaperone [uncultured Enterobacter sp.]
MSATFTGFIDSPAARVTAAFESVARKTLHDGAFLHPEMPVHASAFTLFEGQWTGCVITPWLLSALILPGPQQQWPARNIGEKIALALPIGTMTFSVGELDTLGQYLACSLMSPLARTLTVDQGIRLANDCGRMLLSLPVNAPASPARRALLFGRSGLQDA